MQRRTNVLQRVGATLLASVVTGVSLVLAVAAEPPKAEAEPSLRSIQQFLADYPLDGVVYSRIATANPEGPGPMFDRPTIAFTSSTHCVAPNAQAKRTADLPSLENVTAPLYVYDLDGDGVPQVPDYWPAVGCDSEIDLSSDGRTIVANISVPYSFEFDLTAPDPFCGPVLGDPTHMHLSQVISWTRTGRGEEFGPPVLLSKEPPSTTCPVEMGTPPSSGPAELIGLGGDGFSTSPSITDDGELAAFLSSATSMNPDLEPGATGLFVANTDGTGGPVLVTPNDFDGMVRSAQISGDGLAIVFSAVDGNLEGMDVTDGEQVYVIRREDPEDPWDPDDITLVSEKGSVPLDGTNADPRISADGTRVSFTSTASSIETGVGADSLTTKWVVVRDLGSAGPVRVLLNPEDSSKGYPSAALGQPELSADGRRLSVVAERDGRARFRFFDVDDAVSGDAGDRAEAVVKGATRSLEGSTKRPLGLVELHGDDYIVAMGGDGPLPRYEGSGPAVYLMTGDGIGPEISRGLHGDPVDTANGAYLLDESDLPATKLAKFMSVSRSYSSAGELNGVFGPGWATPFDTRLDLGDELGSVTLELPSGRAVTYTESGGGWSTASGSRSRLEAQTGGGWKVKDPNGEVWSFDPDGLLTSWSSPEGTVTIGARSAEGVPATLSADNGDVLTLTDDKRVDAESETVAGADGRVDRITTSTGTIVDYGYIHNGAGTILHKVTTPHLAGEAAGDIGWTEYQTSGSRITGIIKPSNGGSRYIVQNTYDAIGRVIFQVNETGDELTFDYNKKPAPPAGLVDAPGFTTVTNAASGDVTVYEYSGTGEVLGITDALGNSVARAWTDEQPASSTSRSGVATSYSYDAAGRVLTVSETVGSATVVTSALTYWTPDTDPTAWRDHRVATSTDSAGVTTTYTYDGDLTVPATMAVPCDESSLGAGIDCPSNGLATTTYEYDTTGPVPLLTEQTDPDGVRTTTTYHADDTLASTTVYDDGSVARTTTYDRLYRDDPSFPFDANPAAAWADRSETPSGAVTWEVHRADGRSLATSTGADGEDPVAWASNDYNLDGSVSQAHDSQSGTTGFIVARPGEPFFDTTDPSIAEIRYAEDEDGVVTRTSIDTSGDVVATRIGNPDLGEQATTTNNYGPLGRLLSSTGPTGVLTSYHYDTEGRVTGVTTGPDPDDPAHTVTTEYDSRGRVKSKTTPMGTDPDGNPVQHKISYTYDAAGRKVSQLEGADGPAGETLLTGYEYDDAGRLWRTIEHRHNYTDTANPTTLHNADKVTETRYTLAGRTAQQVGPPRDVASFDWSGADSTKSVTTYGYDEAGRKHTVTAPDEGVTTTSYDVDGRISNTTSPGGYQTSYLYDAAGRTIEKITPSGLTGSGDPATVSTITTYDGRTVWETDPHIPDSDPDTMDPSARKTEHTPGGRVSAVTDANGNTITYGYDSRGNRTSRTALDDTGNNVVESWTYNLADQEATHTVPPPRTGTGAKTTTSTYDPDFGRLATVTDPTNRVRTHAYYNDGTLKQTTYTLGTAAPVVNKFWVNGRGWQTKSTTTLSGTTKTWSSTYDRAGQKLTETSNLGTTTHSYGLAGEQLSLGYPDGTTTSIYLHDPAGRLTEVSVTSGSTTIPYSSYTYDDDGRQTSELIHAAAGATRAWDYNDAGQLTGFTEVLPNTTSTWETYTASLTYRPDGRVATETVNTEPTITYGYDDAGQLTSAVDGVRDRSWTYGTRGNRLTATDGGLTTTYLTNPNASVAKTTQGTHTVTYTYDDAGRLGAEVKKNGTVDEGYTQRGFTTEGYTAGLQVAKPGTTTTSETRGYDAAGRLVKSDTIGGTTVTRHYTWDTTLAIPQIIEAKNSGSTWFRATWGNQRIAFKSGTAAPQWFQYDVRGSVIRTDPTNTDVVIGPDKYGPFGTIDAASGADRIGYRGELTASNLVHLRQRDYDPAIGQFTAPDLLDGVDGTPVAPNPFHYADNDPLNKVDPRGLRPTDDCGSELTGPYFGSCSSEIEFEGPIHPGGGKVAIHFFIKPEHDGFLGVEARGDNRDHDPNAQPWQSRVHVEYDFESGKGFAHASPTCFWPTESAGDCIDARSWSTNWNGGKFLSNTNGIEVNEGSDGSMELRLIARDPITRFAPAISACFNFSAPDDEGYIHFGADTDKYPWVSIYRFAPGGGVDTLWEHGGSWGLIGLSRPYCS